MERRPATGVDVTEDGVDPSLAYRVSSSDALSSGAPSSGSFGPGATNAGQPGAGSTSATGVALDSVDDSVIDAPMPDGASLTAEAVRLAGDDRDLAGLVATYWRFAPDEELVDLSPGAMVAAVRAHRRLASQRLPGELRLDIGPAADGETTVIQIVVDDMPFLVDTVHAALAARGLDVHLLVHPLIVVSREPLGRLVEVHPDVECDDAGPGQLVESWMHLEINRIRDLTLADEVQRDLIRVLTDVREAVEDWPRMRARALELADELSSAQLPVPDRDIADGVELLRWLADDQFTFLGYRQYMLDENAAGEPVLAAVLGTGLGILRQDQPSPRLLSSMTPEAYSAVKAKRLLVITKANSRSTVHRNAYLDYIGIKTFDSFGNVIGEKRFLGLFASAAYLHSVRELPVVRRKVAAVVERSGLSLRGHSGKDLMTILENYPRDELFQIKTDELYEIVMGVLRLAGRRQLRLFLRRDSYGRFVSALVYLPRDRFTTSNRQAIQAILLRELNGVGLDFTTRLGESLLARIYYIVRIDPTAPTREIDVEAIQAQLVAATRNWDDDFRLLLERKLGDEQSSEIYQRYVDALPESYKDVHSPGEAWMDIAKMELLEEPGQLEMHVYRRRTAEKSVRFKVYRHGEPMMLSTVLPVLHSLGVRVSDERPYEVVRPDGTLYIYDFGLVLPGGARAIDDVRPHLENAFAATWRGEAETDGFNELVVRGGLTWRQAVILRSYAKYLRQAGTVFAQASMEAAFIAYPAIAERLVALFETRFSPTLQASEADRQQQCDTHIEEIHRQLDDVASLDQDRILRSYLVLIQATLRTSYYQRGPDARPKAYVALKLDPKAVPDLPAPRPQYEIFVYSARFEGVHLRFGPVARGGLRWSDRRDDFRTEILGLVKAQMVKNAVIVPVGAKGGFVLKAAPPGSDRDAFQAEGVACYKLFISALLDVTDNLVAGSVVPPPGVVRHDGDDPYLVVAADKGTATFSDIANDISNAYGFWMGDAFASGGSAGYDHKKMGITARGAWESVKRHFRDLDHDTQTQDFTVVGIGDMSGDVFGNGMLLSRHVRLIAAFDHRHIFVDPTPDAAVTFGERDRLFGLPRSSWADYDKSLISAGGGVWPRSAKSIPVSPQVRAALGIATGVSSLSPAELMKAILLAPVDLLWNGGIGTYVKAAGETHADVGDKANDSIRVNGNQLRCKVVGEGGNLGLTQRGRIEYAQADGRIYTDFIDNSAGVDCSDHEVNIKILLGGAVTDGTLSMPDRDALLAEMTDEVGTLVLRDNYEQATALGNSQAQTRSLLPVHRRLISELERIGRLDRTLEAMPSDDELAIRADAGRGLTAPEFAVLLAYVKIDLESEIVSSTLPDDPWTAEVCSDYFPTPLRDKYADRMGGHALRRQIITTQLVNEVVNRGGTTFVFRAIEETGATAADVIRAYVIVREVFGLRDLWQAVEDLDSDHEVPTDAQTAIYLEMRRLMDRAVRWLLSNRRAPLDVPNEINLARPGVAQLMPRLDTLFCGVEADAVAKHVKQVVSLDIPEELAARATKLSYSFGLLDVVSLAAATGHKLIDVAGVYFALSERFHVDALLSKISELPREDRWQTLARMALRYDLYAALTALTREVLASAPDVEAASDQERAAAKVRAWEAANSAAIDRARKAMVDFEDSRADLAVLSVMLRQIRTLANTAAA
jgi:glutamate dehydrogenase